MKRKLAIAGLKAIGPLCVGAFPFSFIVGALSITAGMTIAQSAIWSCTVFAGSSQMVAIGLIQASASIIVIAFTTFVINLRHLLYSASMSDHMKEYPFFIRMLMSYGLTDEVFASTIQHMKGNKENRHVFYLAAMFGFWINWVIADLLGATIGSSFPQIANYGLDFAMIAAFIAIVMPQLHNRECITAAIVATISGLLLSGLPYSLGLVIAAVLGVFAGYRMDLATERQTQAKKTTTSQIEGDMK